MTMTLNAMYAGNTEVLSR